jgi:aspartokinase
VITGVAGKKHFSVITIEKDMMNAEIGFGRRVLDVLEDNEIAFEHLPSGVDTLSVVVSSDYLADDRREKMPCSLAPIRAACNLYLSAAENSNRNMEFRYIPYPIYI